MTVSEQLGTLDAILAYNDLNTLFQPIVSLSMQCIMGYEALTRGPSNSPLHAPLTLFSAARQAGRLSELELASRASACRRFGEQTLNGKLFLNVSPELLLEATHRPGRTLELIKAFGIIPSQVVIELTEQAPIEDFNLLHAALKHYRAMGFSIAIDDLGAGYSSLRLWSELRPDYVKVDRHFIDGIHLDALKREFVGSILKIANASNAHVIAEGIELAEELEVLKEMGVDLVQGYLLARPSETPPKELGTLLPYAPTHNWTEDSTSLSDLLLEVSPVSDTTSIHEVQLRLQQALTLNSLPVLDQSQRPIGIVHRQSFSNSLLKPYANDLFARKPITRLMREDYLAVELSQPLQHVSRLLTSRTRQRVDEDFIIVKDGFYMGMGRIIDVLKLITEHKVQQARHANPLTLLPGNIPIQQCLARLLAKPRYAAICYVDIDHFKPFNDVYGYAKGDDVLLTLAQCLKDKLDPHCEFVGHIGGDDFLLVLSHTDWLTRLNSLQQAFALACEAFYHPEHLHNDQFVARNRKGQLEGFGLLSLSIGAFVLHPEDADRYDPARLAELASRAKQEAKANSQTHLFVLESHDTFEA